MTNWEIFFLGVLVGIAISGGWLYRLGGNMAIDIMEAHYKSKLPFDKALDYEKAVRKGEIPRG